jgi:hypothetical protein
LPKATVATQPLAECILNTFTEHVTKIDFKHVLQQDLTSQGPRSAFISEFETQHVKEVEIEVQRCLQETPKGINCSAFYYRFPNQDSELSRSLYIVQRFSMDPQVAEKGDDGSFEDPSRLARSNEEAKMRFEALLKRLSASRQPVTDMFHDTLQDGRAIKTLIVAFKKDHKFREPVARLGGLLDKTPFVVEQKTVEQFSEGNEIHSFSVSNFDEKHARKFLSAATMLGTSAKYMERCF